MASHPRFWVCKSSEMRQLRKPNWLRYFVSKSLNLRVLNLAFVPVLTLVWLSVELRAFNSAAQAVTQEWQLPIQIPANLVRPYLQPSSDYSAGHRGVDYQVSLGDPVFAPADAVVWFSGKVVDRELISLSHSGGILTAFEPVCDSPPPGTAVSRGDVIGVVCDADPQYRQHCTGLRCLHFSMRIDGKYISPLALIGGLSPSRLLPWGPQN